LNAVRIGFDAPLPPAASGVADYAAALLAALRERAEVVVPGAAAERWLYHLGNNALHQAIYQRALATPGVVVLHDAVLIHFYLGMLDAARFEDEFAFNYGEWRRGQARDLWRRRARSMADPEFFAHPLLRRPAETARAVVVHNRRAARLVAEHAPGARVEVIPLLLAPAPAVDAGSAQDWRLRHGVGPRTYLFGVFGYLRESKRLLPILRAFARVRASGADAALLVAGPWASQDLERAAAPLVAAPGIVRVGYTPETEFRVLASAVDACLNLRYPSAGETSDIALRLMGAGKPVVFTAGEEIADLPADTRLAVAAGLGEEAELQAVMEWLARQRAAARDIGARAAAHVRREHALDRVAQRYLEVLAR
jgi:glycosyltransferase involved in cell wall biosynthesis